MNTQVTTYTTRAESCIFCKIVNKQVPASLIYEDNEALAFLDIRPLNEGHTLVIPKGHYENIFDVPEDIVCHVHKLVKRLAIAIKAVTKADGITIIQQNGQAAGQEVFHLHVHVVPRYSGQKLPHFRDLPNASRENLEQQAEAIRQHLQP